MGSLIKKALDHRMKRRTFLKGAAVTSAALALTGYGGLAKVSEEKAAEVAQEEGKWIPAACWHTCGGRCLNYALVKDGVVIRQKTDDTHPDSPDYPQQRSCARGHCQQYVCFGVDRLKYPMKRKHWEPGGGDKSLRGRDEWVRISWDEALDIVASEIKRIKGKYGNEAIFGEMRGNKDICRTLNLYGGYVPYFGTGSSGTWSKTGPVIGIRNSSAINDRMEMRKCDLVVLWGHNTSWSGAGNPTYNEVQNKKISGAKYIIVDPWYSDTAAVLADEWIPIRPTTDHAMLLGMAYTLITEDNPLTNPLIDWDLLNRCTVGFDAEHMPEGAGPKENFKDYVLGTYDGQPKTPEWASERCGVPAERIRSLAIEIGSTRNVALGESCACARHRNGDSWPQMFQTLGFMTGHIGRSGSFTNGGYYQHRPSGLADPPVVKQGSGGVPGIEDALEVTISRQELWDTIATTHKYTAGYQDVRDINIQLIYHSGNCLQTTDGMTKGIAAHRAVEFVVTQNYVPTTTVRYSDVVLPVTTQWERYGMVSRQNREALFWFSQVTEPLYEAKDDIWIAKEIGARLGLDPQEIDPIPLKQQILNQVAGATVMKDDGSGYEPLVTITAQDIAELDVEGEPQSGKIPIKEFKEKGVYQVPRSPGDNFEYVALKEFREDPEANPLKTASGKFPIHCQALADKIKAYGWTEVRPIPTYPLVNEGYEYTFADWENKIKGDYPLQLITLHYPRRAHTNFDSVPYLRYAFPHDFIMNADDAAERGIKDGDTVLVTSPHGKVIRPVWVTERFMPGVCSLPHGAWVEMDEESGIDKAGADNILNGAVPTGQSISGWNSCNVQVEKYVGPIKLEPDYKWPPRKIF